MKYAPRVLVAAALILLLAAFVGAQKGQQTARVKTRRTIEIGQALADVKAAARDHGFGEAGFARAFHPDVAHFAFAIEPSEVYADVFYSKATEKVTGLSLCFMPRHNASKTTQSWVPAKSIVLQEDGSYVVHFLPMPKEVPHKLPASEYPRGPRP